MLRADVHLAVVGDHHQRRTGRQRLEDVADEAIDGAQLGVVERSEPALVGDLVEAVVVGVDERLTGGELVADLDRDARRRPPTDGCAPAQVGLAEGRVSSSAGLTTGTAMPRNAGNGCTSRGGSVRRSRSLAEHHRNTLTMAPPKTTR